jgi:hypothetical protein
LKKKSTSKKIKNPQIKNVDKETSRLGFKKILNNT